MIEAIIEVVIEVVGEVGTKVVLSSRLFCCLSNCLGDRHHLVGEPVCWRTRLLAALPYTSNLGLTNVELELAAFDMMW